ncbi:MAG: YncE family protein [Longimicrobiales bacterium]
MKKVLLGAFLVTSVTAGSVAQRSTPNPFAPAPHSFPSPSPLLYVCNQNDASVSILDAATLKLVRIVDLKPLGFSANAKPHHIVVEPDGSFWYVTLIGDNKIVKLDRNDRVVAQVTFETPGMMALHPSQDLLFVGRSMTAVNPPPRIGVVRRSDLKLEEIDVLFPRPHAMVIEPKNGIVYTASLAVNQMAAVDPSTERVELTQVAGPAHALMQFTVSPDGNTLAVSAELSARVLLFDITERMKPKLVAVLDVERQPFDPMFSPDGRWVVLGNKAANAVTIIDARQRKVAAVVRGQGLAQPHGIAISADSRTAFVTNNNLKGTGEHAGHTMVGGSEGTPAAPAGPGTVVAINLTTQRIAQVIEVGHNASGIAITR